MARRPNYGFEKRQKELQRQKKKEAKAERKELKKKELTDTAEAGSDERDPREDAEEGDDD